MSILYDYLTLVGDTNWYAAPAEVVSTRNVEAIRISSAGGSAPLTGPQVISSALGPASASSPPPAAASQPASAPAKSHPAAKKTGGQ
jgi:hypothetical protein